MSELEDEETAKLTKKGKYEQRVRLFFCVSFFAFLIYAVWKGNYMPQNPLVIIGRSIIVLGFWFLPIIGYTGIFVFSVLGKRRASFPAKMEITAIQFISMVIGIVVFVMVISGIPKISQKRCFHLKMSSIAVAMFSMFSLPKWT